MGCVIPSDSVSVRGMSGREPGLIPDGSKVKKLRMRRGLTRLALSQMTGRRSESMILKVEAYNQPVSEVHAFQIVNALTRAGRAAGLEKPVVELRDILADPSQAGDLDEAGDTDEDELERAS